MIGVPSIDGYWLACSDAERAENHDQVLEADARRDAFIRWARRWRWPRPLVAIGVALAAGYLIGRTA